MPSLVPGSPLPISHTQPCAQQLHDLGLHPGWAVSYSATRLTHSPWWRTSVTCTAGWSLGFHLKEPSGAPFPEPRRLQLEAAVQAPPSHPRTKRFSTSMVDLLPSGHKRGALETGREAVQTGHHKVNTQSNHYPWEHSFICWQIKPQACHLLFLMFSPVFPLTPAIPIMFLKVI